MQNLKIRVNEDNASEVIDLLVGLGHETLVPKEKLLREVANGYRQIADAGNGLFTTVGFYDVKEITLPELRAMVNPMKEYLVPDNGGYRIAVQDASLPIAEDWIEIQEGMNFAYKDDMYTHFTKLEMGYRDAELIWQRATHPEELPFIDDNPQSLNDQYAEIEEVRKAIKVKSGGDSDHMADAMSYGLMGAGAAKGGAKPRENSHYFIDVSDVNEVDFYEIAKRYNVADPAIQHILKKCLAIGNRGHKDLETDLKDILKTAKRALQINGFGDNNG